MEHGVQLYGRRTWEHFARLWPSRTDNYARLMNAVPKRVATRTGIDTTAWRELSGRGEVSPGRTAEFPAIGM